MILWREKCKAASTAQKRGHIRRRVNSLYAGVDPLTGKRVCLRDDGRGRGRRILDRFRPQVDEQRSVQARGTFRTAFEEWLQVHELDDFAREAYRNYARR